MDGSQPHSAGISVSGTIEQMGPPPDGSRLALSTLDASSEIWVIAESDGTEAEVGMSASFTNQVLAQLELHANAEKSARRC